MRQFTRKTVTLAVAGAVAGGMFMLAAPADAVCYPVETGPAGVSPCASLVNNCVDSRVYFRVGGSGNVGTPQVCLP